MHAHRTRHPDRPFSSLRSVNERCESPLVVHEVDGRRVTQHVRERGVGRLGSKGLELADVLKKVRARPRNAQR